MLVVSLVALTEGYPFLLEALRFQVLESVVYSRVAQLVRGLEE